MNEKIENQLNLSLNASEEERQKSLNLSTGYNQAEQVWEVIVQYQGDLEERLTELLGSGERSDSNDRNGWSASLLSNSYAILKIPESMVEAVAALPEVIYMEKPKRLFFAIDEAKRASCITSVQQEQTGGTVGEGLNVTGEGVLIAVIDSGERVIIMSN